MNRSAPSPPPARHRPSLRKLGTSKHLDRAAVHTQRQTPLTPGSVSDVMPRCWTMMSSFFSSLSLRFVFNTNTNLLQVVFSEDSSVVFVDVFLLPVLQEETKD